MTIQVTLADINRHCARMKELAEEERRLREIAEATPAERTQALDDETHHYVEVHGPRLNEEFSGVRSMDPSRRTRHGQEG